jgi:trimethylamine--corrinoid protein Co-methyltransferase
MLHEYTMQVLEATGVAFHSEKILKIFKRHGMKVDGNVVRFQPDQITAALQTAPSSFTVKARNRKNDLHIGGHETVFAPGYGPPFIITPDGLRRSATMDDYENFCRLVQSSQYINCNGHMMVQPSDIPSDTAHLDMLAASLRLCDKVFMGASGSEQMAMDSLEMARIIWPDLDSPVMISLISSLCPLQFAQEMAESLIVFAQAGQPIIVMGGGMLGATSPIDISSFIVVQNAVFLAGLCLTQLVCPGAPVIYGVGGAPLDMKTGNFSIGAPEEPVLIRLGSQMAKFYNLPCRGGGALTDAVTLDYQAGMESMATLFGSVKEGVDFILHSCGILETYLSMSYEKFLADEEMCGYILQMSKLLSRIQKPPDLDLIRRVGIGGEYLTCPETLKHCRTEFFQPDLAWRRGYPAWDTKGKKPMAQRISEKIEVRLRFDGQPKLDRELDKALANYIKIRKANG